MLALSAARSLEAVAEVRARFQRDRRALHRHAVAPRFGEAPKVLIGTMYAGENELEACRASVAAQSYAPLEHTLIEGLGEREATAELMARFRQSDAEILVKLDADMVLIDRHFVRDVVQLLRHRPQTSMVQMALTDFNSGGAMQGINAYTRAYPWSTAKQDSLFTDYMAIPGRSKLIVPQRFVGAALHCPNPSPFQAFHFGVHRGLKVVQPGAPTYHFKRASAQMQYLERTWRHFERRRDVRLGFAVLGFEYALTHPLEVAHVNYANPHLRELFNTYERWSAMRTREEILRLRGEPAVSPQVQQLREERGQLEQSSDVAIVRGRRLSRAMRDSAAHLRATGLACHEVSLDDIKGLSLADATTRRWGAVLCDDWQSGAALTLPLFTASVHVAILPAWASYAVVAQCDALKMPVACLAPRPERYPELAPAAMGGPGDLADVVSRATLF